MENEKYLRLSLEQITDKIEITAPLSEWIMLLEKGDDKSMSYIFQSLKFVNSNGYDVGYFFHPRNLDCLSE